jgi:hypothetical protein
MRCRSRIPLQSLRRPRDSTGVIQSRARSLRFVSGHRPGATYSLDLGQSQPGLVLPFVMQGFISKANGAFGVRNGINLSDVRSGACADIYKLFSQLRNPSQIPSQSLPQGAGGELISELLRAISAECGWLDFKPLQPTTAPIEALALPALAGHYRGDRGSAVTVTYESGRSSFWPRRSVPRVSGCCMREEAPSSRRRPPDLPLLPTTSSH